MLKVSPIVFPSSLHTGNEKVYSIMGKRKLLFLCLGENSEKKPKWAFGMPENLYLPILIEKVILVFAKSFWQMIRTVLVCSQLLWQTTAIDCKKVYSVVFTRQTYLVPNDLG